MNRFDALAATQKERAVSTHVPITHLNSPTVFESKSGMQGSVLKLKGVTFDTEKDSVLNNHKNTWQNALNALDERFCVVVTVHRRKESRLLEGSFSNDFARSLDAAYHEQFKNESVYVNDIYLTLIYKGITTGKAGKGLNLLQKITKKTIRHAREAARFSQMKVLARATGQLMESLKAFGPRLLGEQDERLGRSELMTFLSLPLNGGDKQCYARPHCLPVLSQSIRTTLTAQTLYPDGHLGQYLPTKQLFFGDAIQFQGALKRDRRFGAIVTIKRYGQESASIMLDTLLHLDSEFIQTNSFAIEAKDVALLHIKRQIIKRHNVNDAAVSQLDALHEAENVVASDTLSMGYHHNTLLLLSDTKEALDDNVAKAIKCYSDAGLVAVKETLGQEPAFWAQIPTNLKYIARSSLITSENFVDFAPLHNYRTGYRDKNHLGSAVTLLETPSKTPYFFNYHAKGTKKNPSKGHSLIIGGNDSGKTVLMTFLDAQMSRYGGNTFYFDRDRGAEIYIRATGGDYMTLSPEHPDNTRFNPLQMQDTKDNRKFNYEWFKQLCKADDNTEIDTDDWEHIKQCVDYAYDALAKQHRTLSNTVKILPLSFKHRAALRRFLRAEGKYPDGEYAYIFDNETDGLSLSTTTGFDMTHFLDNEPSTVRTAVFMYLFHQIDSTLDGRRVSILLDEGWQYFIDPYWKTKLEKWLPTVRKKNAHIVIGTQSPSSIITSPVKSQLLDNAATLLFFANPQATREDYIDGFKLTYSEFDCIAGNPPESRLFLVKQAHSSCLCRLNLGHLPDLLSVLSGNAASVRLLDNIRSEVGDLPEDWLPLFYQRLRGQTA